MFWHPFKLKLRFTTLALLLSGLTIPIGALASNPSDGINNISVCMNFSCRKTQIISISQKDWDSVANWFKPVALDAESERLNLKNAIGWMEVIVGRYTPTYRDYGGDLGNPEAQFPGQLDCIDESLNTTTYLKLFERNGLLKYHQVTDRAYRRAIFDQHWSAQIEVIDTGELWVVDSWFQNNGFLPYLQSTDKWLNISLLTANLDSSQPKSRNSFFSRLFN
jgi:hypothetical protein